jgi:hypothetical protein
MDIIEKLEDLVKQATTERSHYYVASTAREAASEIKKLRESLGIIAEQDSGKVGSTSKCDCMAAIAKLALR